MKCPACDGALSEIQAGKVKVDVCKDGCAGVWFDWNEIRNFDEPHEIDAAPILALKKKPGMKRHEPPLPCPRCEGEVLVRQYFDPKSEVEIDLCWSCSGVWLDPGELETIRSQWKTQEERQKAGDQFVDEILRDHKQALSDATAEEVAKLDDQNRSILHAFFHSFRRFFDPMDDGMLR